MMTMTTTWPSCQFWLRHHAIATTIATIETLAGLRPVTQLKWRATPAVYQLARYIHDQKILSGACLESMRMEFPNDSVMEITVRVSQNSRSHAVALRLEKTHHWACTDLTTAVRVGNMLVPINRNTVLPPPKYDRQ